MKGGFRYNLAYSFIPRKPALLARLAYNTIKAKVFGKRVLRYIDVCVSTRCNLGCAHCFASSFNEADTPPLSLDEWGKVARQCMALGAVSFGITGGEPLLFEDLIPLVRRLSPWKNLITINTNGTLLTNNLAKDLHKEGVDVIQFSMDSIDPAEHNEFRGGDGVLEKVIDAVDIARANKLKVTLVCTVSHRSLRTAGVQGVLEFAREKGLLVILSRATPAGEWLGRRDILLSREDQDFMYNLVRRNAHVRTDMDTNFGPYGCSAGSEKLYVTPYGAVIPCPFMHIQFGNVRQDDIRTVRNRMLSVERLGSYCHTCHVAEDREFIENTLCATFKQKKVVDWTDCFPANQR